MPAAFKDYGALANSLFDDGHDAGLLKSSKTGAFGSGSYNLEFSRDVGTSDLATSFSAEADGLKCDFAKDGVSFEFGCDVKQVAGLNLKTRSQKIKSPFLIEISRFFGIFSFLTHLSILNLALDSEISPPTTRTKTSTPISKPPSRLNLSFLLTHHTVAQVSVQVSPVSLILKLARFKTSAGDLKDSKTKENMLYPLSQVISTNHSKAISLCSKLWNPDLLQLMVSKLTPLTTN